MAAPDELKRKPTCARIQTNQEVPPLALPLAVVLEYHYQHCLSRELGNAICLDSLTEEAEHALTYCCGETYPNGIGVSFSCFDALCVLRPRMQHDLYAAGSQRSALSVRSSGSEA